MPAAVRGIHGLAQGRGHGLVPCRAIESVFGCRRGLLEEFSGVLDRLPGRIGIEIHDVVRVYEADEQAPRLARVGQRAADPPQPGHGAAPIT